MLALFSVAFFGRGFPVRATGLQLNVNSSRSQMLSDPLLTGRTNPINRSEPDHGVAFGTTYRRCVLPITGHDEALIWTLPMLVAFEQECILESGPSFVVGNIVDIFSQPKQNDFWTRTILATDHKQRFIIGSFQQARVIVFSVFRHRNHNASACARNQGLSVLGLPRKAPTEKQWCTV